MDALSKLEGAKTFQSNKETFDIIKDNPQIRSKNIYSSRPTTIKPQMSRYKPYQAKKTSTTRKPFSIKLNQKSSLDFLKPSLKSENLNFPIPSETKDLCTKKVKNFKQLDENISHLFPQGIDEIKLSFDINQNEELLSNLHKYKSNASYKEAKTHKRVLSYQSKLPQSPPLVKTTPKNQVFINAICQTDTMNIENNHIEEILYTNSPELQVIKPEDYKLKSTCNSPRLFGIKTKQLHKALVTSYKIDISLKEYEVKYFINSSLDTIFIHVSSYNEKYEMEFDTEPQAPILDVIKDKIHPYIDIKQGKLILEKVSVENIISGMHVFKSHKYKAYVEKRAPRYEVVIKCKLDNRVVERRISYMEIPYQYREAQADPEIFFTCFHIKDQDIVVEFPHKNNFQLIYYKAYSFNYQSYHLKISEISQKHDSFLLIQALSKSSPPIDSLLINTINVSNIINIQCDCVKDNINKIVSFLVVKNSQIVLRTSFEEDGDRQDEENLIIRENSIDTKEVFKRFLERKELLSKGGVKSEEISKKTEEN